MLNMRSTPQNLPPQPLAALSRGVIHLTFGCLIKKPNKPKKAKDLKLQYSTTENPPTRSPGCCVGICKAWAAASSRGCGTFFGRPSRMWRLSHMATRTGLFFLASGCQGPRTTPTQYPARGPLEGMHSGGLQKKAYKNGPILRKSW